VGASGVNGPVIVPLTNDGSGVWSVPANTVLTADQLKASKQGNLYFNAHSTAFPGGEIRGQIR
ncbi:MAG: CHRD domain-containing protein, partial [Ramlibacter sp.]|nr:CHRD domain-containing protein [Ramlibacter sp.]